MSDNASMYEARLGGLHVGIRNDLTITRQILGGQPSYVVHDPVAFQNHAFSATEYRVITAIVATRSLSECFSGLLAAKQVEEDERDAFYRFVLNLHEMGLLLLPITDPERQYTRFQRRQTAERKKLLSALVYYKVPLWDPDAFLDRTIAVGKLLFSKTGLVVWASLILLAGWSCLGRVGELFADAEVMLTLGNVPLLYVALVGLKALHELGHAYACKRFRGEVPEIGVSFILTTPCAYVDASASWKLTSRWRRITVAMGGMYVESFFAAGAALLWTATEPGLLRDFLVNVVALASIVTVLFNLNPLMRFDGYYVFADLLGIANLRERSSNFLKRWSKWIGLGLPRGEPEDRRRYRWLYGSYGVGAFVYRLTLALTITWVMATRWPMVGGLLGFGFALVLLVRPILNLASYLLTDPETEPVRVRAIALGILVVAVLPLGVLATPMSSSIVAPGVMEPASRHVARARHDGFVVRLGTHDADHVRPGDELVLIDNPALRLEHAQARARANTERTRLEVAETTDPGQARQLRAMLVASERRADLLTEQLSELRIASPLDGVVAADRPGDRAGTFVRRGEPLLEVHGDRRLVHALISQELVERARLTEGARAELRFVALPGSTFEATVRDIRPLASADEIPAGLTIRSGGDLYATVTGDGTSQGAEPYVHVYLEPDELPEHAYAGMTVRVRLAGDTLTVGTWLRRQTLRLYHAWLTS